MMFQHLDNNVLFTVSFVKFTLSDEQHREGKTRTCFLETNTPEMLVRFINLRCYRLEGINILTKCFPFYFLFNSAVKITFFQHFEYTEMEDPVQNKFTKFLLNDIQ